MLGRLTVAAVVVMGMLTQRSDATATQQSIMVYGIVSESCGTWTAEIRNPASARAQTYAWWLLGFVSGASVTLSIERDMVIASTDSDGIKGLGSRL
jgi:hypothetical protein